MIRLIIFLLSLSPVFVFGQKKEFLFEDGLCQYKAYYDEKAYTDEQLRNTYKLVEGHYNMYSDDEADLDENYLNAQKELSNLDIVNSKYFHSLRDSLLIYLKSTYEVKKTQLAAKKGEKHLLKNFYQEVPTIKLYSNALEKGGKTLQKAFEFLTKEQMKNNSNPERLWDEYQNSIKSPNAEQLAFDKVLNYGWWNAVNNELPHINYDGRQFEEFQKLFIKIETIDCDE